MQVIKEVWVLKHKTAEHTFFCAQNTSTPKLYVSENSATSSAMYHAEHYSVNQELVYQPAKAFIVIEGDNDAIPF